MSLLLLLDENISPVVAAQVRQHRPAIAIESVDEWQSGAFRSGADEELLQAALTEHFTLVTYDQRTIPPLLVELAELGQDHSGVIFVDNRTIPNNDLGTLVRALILLWDRFGQEEWQNRTAFLERPIG